MKRVLLLLFVLVLLSFKASADPGNCYCMESSFRAENQTIRGFFQLLGYSEISQGQEAVFKHNEKQFVEFVKSQLPKEEPLHIYKEILLFSIPAWADYDSSQIPILLKHSKVSFPLASIQSIQLHSIRPCSVGMEVISPIKSTDQTWIGNKILKREIFGAETCDYEVFYLGAVNEKARRLVKALRVAVKTGAQQQTEQLLRELKELRIIVIASCSC